MISQCKTDLRGIPKKLLILNFPSVGIATGYGLDGRGKVDTLVHTGFGIYPASYPMEIGDSFPGVKGAGTIG
jgi:hypothetical protein